MATNYDFDRKFTDYVHKNLALSLIYEQLNWKEQDVNGTMLENVDLRNAVDYFLIDMNAGKIITVQERFREVKYQTFSDFTIRFEREYNPHEDRKLSEYYKLDADYFVYGIINSSKFDMKKATDFKKFAVIDVKKLKQLFDSGAIVVDRNLKSYKCKMINGVMYCPVNQNEDRSSSFIPVDIAMLGTLHPEVIVIQKGF